MIDTIKPAQTWVVCPIDDEGYSIRDDIKVAGIGETLHDVRKTLCLRVSVVNNCF